MDGRTASITGVNNQLMVGAKMYSKTRTKKNTMECYSLSDIVPGDKKENVDVIERIIESKSLVYLLQKPFEFFLIKFLIFSIFGAV